MSSSSLSPKSAWRRIRREPNVDNAIDLLFGHVDDLLLAGDFDGVDSFLRAANVEELSKTLAVALLSITRAAKEKLPYREELYYQIKKELKTYFDSDEIDRLLRGLH